MSLLTRWRRRNEDITLGVVPRPNSTLRVLRADGQRIDLTARDAGTRLALVRQGWQADAWQYRDMIGELRFAQRLEARAVADARFYAAELRAYPEGPVELTGSDHDLDQGLANDAVENLARLPLDDGPDGFIATLTENLETAGEAWIHGEPDETWSVRSVSEIVGAGDQILLSELPTISTTGQRVINPESEELLRCWTRHPRWGQLADSPLRAMLDVLEEVVLAGREMRAAARSRIASNGILLIPNSLSLLRTRDEEEDLTEQGVPEDDFMRDLTEQGVPEDDFMRDFTEALTAPIRNEGDAGAVVPLILRGDAEALKEVRHLTLARDDAAKLTERQQGALLRMLQGLDIQPEQVTGLGPVNHWSGWMIEASNVRHQVLPMCGIIAGCLTKAFLRPALLALGHPADQVRRVAVWFDASGLVESPDRAQDARDAWDRDAISDQALREALGFGDDHAPESHEYLTRLLSKGRLTPQAVPLVAALSGVDLHDPSLQEALALAVGLDLGGRVVPGQVIRQGTLPAGSTASPAQPGQVTPERPAPATPSSESPGLTATLGSRGTGVDPSLRDRVLVAADAAVHRAVERAEGRIRNAARRNKALTASLDAVDSSRVAATLGRDTVASLVSMPDLLAGAYRRLEGQFNDWLAGEADRPAAWAALTAAMDAATERALFHPDTATRGGGFLIDAAEVDWVLKVASDSPSDIKGVSTG